MPAPGQPRYRTIVRMPRFDGELAVLRGNLQRGDEFVANAEFLLAANPFAGYQLIPSHVWFLPLAERFGRAAIYYTFSEESVWLLSIRAMP